MAELQMSTELETLKARVAELEAQNAAIKADYRELARVAEDVMQPFDLLESGAWELVATGEQFTNKNGLGFYLTVLIQTIYPEDAPDGRYNKENIE